MDFLTINQTNYVFFLGLLLVSSVILAVYKDWSLLTPALVVQYITVAVIANELNETTVRVMLGNIPLAVFLKGVSGIIAGTIFFLTGYALVVERRGHRQQEREEEQRGRGRLRRIFYRQEAAKIYLFRYVDYVLPIGAVIIAAGATYALATLVPFSGNILGDFVFYWLGSIGVAIMVVGRDIMKLGVGLMVTLNGADLLYALLRNGDSPLVLGASAAITILLALLVSYLAILFFGRMKTLNLSERFRRKRRGPV